MTYNATGPPQGLSINASTGLITGTIGLGAANAGSYSPTILVSDGTSSAREFLNWTVSSPITLTPIQSQTSNEGAAVSLQIHATDSTSGSTLTFSAAGLPRGLSINSSTGLISGTEGQ
jgi:hypothetical protein